MSRRERIEQIMQSRHSASVEATNLARQAAYRRGSPGTIAFACFVFTGLCASMPYFITVNQTESLSSKEGALSAAAVRRGSYVNSGSKDVGVDPLWDFKNGRRRRESE